ncbi:chemotaxis protein CheW [Alkalilacustris brevis]|uniref:chemotaxis protein CheW n=1 Tax=Alkalilacustris brevis TaxID=2026338 RepID=UPI000E0E092A|nr:chemotaxis protein CheW [Alkalilacustris brevis]
MTDAAEQHPVSRREIVSFRVANQDFCIDIGSVREIRGWTPTTVLPHAPPYVTGVMNLRGAVLPVVDLSARLGLGPTEPSPRHVIIIVMIEEMTAGLLVDAVSDILTVNGEEIKPTPDVAAGPAKTLVEGVLAIDERLIRLIDLGRVFPDHERGEP